MGGIGKTTLAIAIAHDSRVLKHFSDGVLWAGLGKNADVMSLLGQWAEALGVGESIATKVTELERTQAIKNIIGQRHFLLVIDDAWDIQAAEWLRCGGPNCCHLLTTRVEDIAQQFAGASQVESLPTLSSEAAFDLLCMLAPEAVKADSDTAQYLVEIIGFLPLAIELIGGYLADPKHGGRFIAQQRQAMSRLSDPEERMKILRERLGSHTRGQRVSLKEVIQLSVSDLHPTAQETFYTLGAFASKPTTFSVEAALAVAEVELISLSELINHNLLEQQADDCLAIHQTLADYARIYMPSSKEIRHRMYYLDEVNKNREDWNYIDTIYLQLKYAWKNAPHDMCRLDLIWAARIYQDRRGLWQDQIDWHQVGLTVAPRAVQGTLHNNIGTMFTYKGARGRALESYQCALEIWEAIGEIEGMADTLTNIGVTYDDLGKYEQALESYKRALNMYDQAKKAQKQGIVLNNIGRVYIHLEDYEQALQYYQRVIAIREIEDDKYGMGVTYNNIARVYIEKGDFPAAFTYLQHALEIYREHGVRSGIGTALCNFGYAHLVSGDKQQALLYQQDALAIFKEIDDQPGQALMLERIGLIYEEFEDYAHSVDYYEEAIIILEAIDSSTQLSNVLNKLGFGYHQMGGYQEALKNYKRAVSIAEEIGTQLEMAYPLNNIGKVYSDLGDYLQALEYYRLTLIILENTDDKYLESITHYNIAVASRKQGHFEKAIMELRQAIELAKVVQNPRLGSYEKELTEIEGELSVMSRSSN